MMLHKIKNYFRNSENFQIDFFSNLNFELSCYLVKFTEVLKIQ